VAKVHPVERKRRADNLLWFRSVCLEGLLRNYEGADQNNEEWAIHEEKKDQRKKGRNIMKELKF